MKGAMYEGIKQQNAGNVHNMCMGISHGCGSQLPYFMHMYMYEQLYYMHMVHAYYIPYMPTFLCTSNGLI